MDKEDKDQAPEGAQGASSEGEEGEIVNGDGAELTLDPAFAESIREVSKREQLAELIVIRDRAKEPELMAGQPNEDFIPYRDCDALFAAGTIVDFGGVPCRLLVDAPVMSASLRDEQAFADVLSRTPGNLAANAGGLRGKYNALGRMIGVNEDHGYNRLLAEIARLEEQIKAEEAVEAAAAAEQQSEA